MGALVLKMNTVTRCQTCGAQWAASDLKKTGVEHFGAPHLNRVIIEPKGLKWAVSFNSDGKISSIDQCNRCPIIMQMISVTEE